MKIFTFELLFSAFLKEIVFSTYNITYLDDKCKEPTKYITLDNKGHSSAVVIENTILSNEVVDCERLIEAPFDGQVLVSVRKHNVPGPCDTLTLQVNRYAKENVTTPISAVTFCAKNGSVKKDYVYDSPVIFGIYGKMLVMNSTQIEVLLVASKQEPCGGHYNFKCPKGVCISDCLVCDGYSHCSDNSDENKDICNRNSCDSEGSNVGLILGIVFGTLIAAAVVSAAVWITMKKRPVAVKEEGAAQQDAAAKPDATQEDAAAAKPEAAPEQTETTTP